MWVFFMSAPHAFSSFSSKHSLSQQTQIPQVLYFPSSFLPFFIHLVTLVPSMPSLPFLFYAFVPSKNFPTFLEVRYRMLRG